MTTPKLTVVPHDIEKCTYCLNPGVRAAVQAEQTNAGWMCSVCGWATTDLGTMHEQLWPTSVRPGMEPGVDMVCPGCGAIGAFVDYPEETSGD